MTYLVHITKDILTELTTYTTYTMQSLIVQFPLFQGFYRQLCSDQVQIWFKHLSTALPTDEAIHRAICGSLLPPPEKQPSAGHG